MDFTLEEGDHVRLAVEVDGWDKTGRGAGRTKGESPTGCCVRVFEGAGLDVAAIREFAGGS